MIVMLAVASALAGRPPADGLAWQWDSDEVRRYYIETEVQLPQYLWIAAERNAEARLVAFKTRAVMTCQGEPARKNRSSIRCRIEDASFVGASMPGDAGLLTKIVPELDDRLTGAEAQFQQREDGRMSHFDIQFQDGPADRRDNIIQNNLTLIAFRMFAGFDLRLPRSGTASDGLWVQYDDRLFEAPSAGAPAPSEVVHGVMSVDNGLVKLESSGRGTAVLQQGFNTYATRMESVAAFDTVNGGLRERQWTLLGEPTAGSAVAQGTSGVPYGQRGFLRWLDTNEKIDVGESLESAPPGDAPGNLTAWAHLGSVQ
jgi:hypothetical protein